MTEAGNGEVGQRAALEHRPDPLDRIKVMCISGQPEHPQPGLAILGGECPTNGGTAVGSRGEMPFHLRRRILWRTGPA